MPQNPTGPDRQQGGGRSRGSGGSESDAEATRELWRLSGMGLEFVGVVAGMIALGWLLDRWLQTTPWLLLTGAFVGLAGGAIRFVREARAASRRAQAAYMRKHHQDDPPG